MQGLGRAAGAVAAHFERTLGHRRGEIRKAVRAEGGQRELRPREDQDGRDGQLIRQHVPVGLVQLVEREGAVVMVVVRDILRVQRRVGRIGPPGRCRRNELAEQARDQEEDGQRSAHGLNCSRRTGQEGGDLCPVETRARGFDDVPARSRRRVSRSACTPIPWPYSVKADAPLDPARLGPRPGFHTSRMKARETCIPAWAEASRLTRWWRSRTTP